MPTVELDSTFTVYADIEDADAYADGASHAASWRALTDDDAKARYLITATRILDRQRWKDEYNTVALRAVEQNIIDASIEMAFALLDGSDLQTAQSTAEHIRTLTAGSVSITNFRGVDQPMRFPQIVTELLRGYLGGSSSSFVATVTGEDTETIFPVELGYNLGGL